MADKIKQKVIEIVWNLIDKTSGQLAFEKLPEMADQILKETREEWKKELLGYILKREEVLKPLIEKFHYDIDEHRLNELKQFKQIIKGL